MSEERTATGLGFPTVGNAREFSEGTGMLSIKKLMEEEVKFAKVLLEDKGFDNGVFLKIETQKAEYELRQIINRTERTLIDEQGKDLPNQVRIDSVHKTYNSLLFIWRRMMKQSARIVTKRRSKELRKETK
jgi:glycerophosphoryl diester phosphodiesterase